MIYNTHLFFYNAISKQTEDISCLVNYLFTTINGAHGFALNQRALNSVLFVTFTVPAATTINCKLLYVGPKDIVCLYQIATIAVTYRQKAKSTVADTVASMQCHCQQLNLVQRQTMAKQYCWMSPTALAMQPAIAAFGRSVCSITAAAAAQAPDDTAIHWHMWSYRTLGSASHSAASRNYLRTASLAELLYTTSGLCAAEAGNAERQVAGLHRNS